MKNKTSRKSPPKKRSAQKKRLVEGSLSVARAGFAFLKPKNGGKDLFIPEKYVGHAIDGDTVVAEALPEKFRRTKFGDPAFKVIKIVSRKRKSAVGELIHGKKIRPLSNFLANDIPIAGISSEAVKGSWIEAEMPNPDDKGRKKSMARFKSVIGKVGDIKADLEAVRIEYSILKPYTEDENERAVQLEAAKVDRLDLTGLKIFTIDPTDAKDFDDAVSIQLDGDRTILGVHIADVSSWIRPGSEFDLKAKERGFTSYLPGMTLPMLPRSFTRMASLVEGCISSANSLLIAVDAKSGEVISSSRRRSTIKVSARLSFDDLQTFIEKGVCGKLDADSLKCLGSVVKLARKMREFRRSTERFLNLETVSSRAVFDESETRIVGIKMEKQREAERIVEECMLAANVEVAKELDAKGIPGLFRIHDEPDPEKIAEFCEFVRSSFDINPGDISRREKCDAFLSELPEGPKKQVICDSFLRALPRAVYSAEPSMHYGLGKYFYSHFTSPIRRYPDLAVHQQLLASDCRTHMRSRRDFEEIAADTSSKEENNDRAYYAANDRMKLHFLKNNFMDEASEPLEGVILKITGKGLLVNLPAFGLNGLVLSERLGPFSPGRRNPGSPGRDRIRGYKCGDFIYLKIDLLDLAKGTVFFRPV